MSNNLTCISIMFKQYFVEFRSALWGSIEMHHFSRWSKVMEVYHFHNKLLLNHSKKFLGVGGVRMSFWNREINKISPIFLTIIPFSSSSSPCTFDRLSALAPVSENRFYEKWKLKCNRVLIVKKLFVNYPWLEFCLQRTKIGWKCPERGWLLGTNRYLKLLF